MCASPDKCDDRLLSGFNAGERILMSLSFWGMLVMGVVGIAMQSGMGAMSYAAMCLGLLIGPVARGLCSHCPYPAKYGTCLFFPLSVISRLAPYGGPHMSRLDKIAWMGSLVLMLALPTYWLVSDPLMLLVFWVVAAPMLLGFPLHYCRRCRHFACPMNKVPRALRREDADA